MSTTFGVVSLGVFIILAAIITTGCSPTRARARAEAQRAFDNIQQHPANDTIKTSDLHSLPPPVRRYLLKAGVVGREHLKTFRGKFRGQMKLGGENAKWIMVKVVQHSFYDSSLTRIFYIKAKMFGIIPIVGLDKYENGKGSMVIRVLDLFTVVNQAGPTMDKSELVTILNDMAMFPTALLNKKVVWEAVNDTSARALLSDDGKTVSALFYFDRNDDLVNFVTDDRTYDDGRGDVRKGRWWTPFRGHHQVAGIRVPSEGDAVWDLGHRRFHYARFTLDHMDYNKFEVLR